MFWKRRIYLDYAAGPGGNPSSAHAEGRKQKQKLEDARIHIARIVECKADDVIFTSGATEANALAILGFAKPGSHMLYLPSAHASIVENMRIAAERFDVAIEPLAIKNKEIDIETLKKQLKLETVLLSMEAVCGETGTIWNTREVKKAIGNVYLHVDASQAVFTEKITRSHFDADLLTLDGTKLGAAGSGALIAHRTIPLAPLYGGGAQERGLRSGTESVEAIHDFARVFARAAEDKEAFNASAVPLRAQLSGFIEKSIPSAYINEGVKNVPHIVNLSLPGRDTDYIVALLDEAGFAISTKSACESGNGEGSRAVLALTGDAERATSTLRISWGLSTGSRDLRAFAAALARAVAFVDSQGST